MEKVSICPECGRILESSFFFCPWCGTAIDTGFSIAARVDSVFEQLESKQKDFTCSRLSAMENSLSELEEELSLLLGPPHPVLQEK